jgi:hypothetical protein
MVLLEEAMFGMGITEEAVPPFSMGMEYEIPFWNFPYPQSFPVTHDGDEQNPYFIGIDPIGWTDESDEEIPPDF